MTYEHMNKQWLYYGIASLASITYVLLTFFTPASSSSARLGLSQEQIFFLRFTIALPYVVTWFLAMYGLSRLKHYINSTKKKDLLTTLLRYIWLGFLWIVLGTISAAIIGGVRQYFNTNTDVYPIITIILNYFYVFPSLIGYVVFYLGVKKLRNVEELALYKKPSYFFNTLLVLIISVFYIYLVFTNPAREFSSDPDLRPTYFLPDPVIIATIISPLVITWWFGFYAAFAIGDAVAYFAREEIFRGISRILYGIWTVIFASILLESLLALGTQRLLHIGLGLLLLIIYIFVILQGVGYLFLALGSNTLLKSLKGK